MAQGKKSSIVKKILIGLLVVIVVIQFIRPAKNNNTAVTPDNMGQIYPIPADVYQVLDKACFDCHSNNTRYPWYANVQPVAWWLDDHIDEGKHELNFSEFGKRKITSQVKKLRKLAEEVEEGEMPLSSYTWIHKEAVLTPAEKQLVVNWAKNLADSIAKTVPAENKKG